MRKPIIVLACTLFLGCALKSHARDKNIANFLQHLEVGTNVIPLVDSLSLNFDNLMFKYYYGENQNRAIRLNIDQIYYLKPNIFDETIRFHRSIFSFEIGHIWFQPVFEKIQTYWAIDFKFEKYKNIIDFYSPDVYSSNLSFGLKYKINKFINIELETRLSFILNHFQWNYWSDNIYYSGYTNSLNFNYKPLNFLTLNYKFK